MLFAANSFSAQPGPAAGYTRRLPVLSGAAVAPPPEVAPPANPCRVPTAASTRYRNDPYRARVVVTPSETGAAEPQPTAGDKLAPSLRRGQLLRSSSSNRAIPPLHRTANATSGAADAAGGLQTPLPPPIATRPRRHSTSRVHPPPTANAAQQQHAAAAAAAAAAPHATDASEDQPQNRQSDAGPAKIALIQFKRTMMSALYDSSKFHDLTVDEQIIVEGDRGEHLATVARLNVRKSKSTPTLIVRRATAADLEQHERVKEDEAVALEACRAHAQRLGLDDVMSIVDVEFQLDFQKLTVFFRAKNPDSFVDFRSLQRALYQHFRCRIWIIDG